MSTSNSHQILEKTEPSRGVKHMKPPIRPKPVLPPRPKDISAPGAENKSPLPSPTCGPLSPTLDIPSALKISQLTGPQPYGTRRTSLKRWSSSVGEEVSQENNALSPVENRSIEVVGKITAQPVSAPAKPPHTAPAWRGKSPFMLTTRGWGEQRFNQLRDLNESESASQKPGSSLPSKDTDAEIRGTTANEEDSRNPSRSTPEEESATHVRDSIASFEKLAPRASEDGKMVSSGSGPSTRPAQIKDYEKQSTAPLQSDPHDKSSEQSDHQEDRVEPPSIGYKTEKKVPSVPIRKSLQGPKSQTEEENLKNAIVYSEQIPEVGPGHVLLSEDVIVDQRGLKNRDKNQHPGPHGDHQDDAEVTPKKYTQQPDTDYEQPPQHQDGSQDKHVASKPLPPKPKERKKPSVQFMVPNVEEQEEGQRSMGWTVQETKEYRHEDDGEEDVRRWDRQEDIVQKPTLHRQQKAEEEDKQGTSAGKDKPSHLVGTQISSYIVTTDQEICQDDSDVGQPEVHGSSFHHRDLKVTSEEEEEEETHSAPHTTGPYEDVEHGSQETKQAEDDEHRGFYTRHTEVKNVDYVPHFARTPSDSLRSEPGNDASSAPDSETSYIHHYKSTTEHSEFHENTDRKPESQSDDKLPSQEIYTYPKEFHPSSAPAEPQEDLTQNYDPESSPRPGHLQGSESSKAEEVTWSHFEDPTCRVLQSTEFSDRRDHRDGIQYYNTYSQEGEHGGDELEEHHHSHGRLEEELHGRALSEKPVHTYVQSGKPAQGYSQSEEESHNYAVLKKAKYGDDEVETVAYTYQPPEEPDHPEITSQEENHGETVLKKAAYKWDQPERIHETYKQPEESSHPHIQSQEENHGEAVLKKTAYKWDQPERQYETYKQPEELSHPQIQSQEEKHGETVLKKATYEWDQPEIIHETYKQPEESSHPHIQSQEEKHGETVLKKTAYEWDQPEIIHETYKQPEEPSHPHIQSQEEKHGETVLKKTAYEWDQPEIIHETYKQPEEPSHPHIQSQEENHGETVLKKTAYEWDQPERQYETYKQPEELSHPHIQSQEENHGETVLKKAAYEWEPPERQYETYKQPEEPGHPQIQSEEENHGETVLKKAAYEWEPPERQYETYKQPEEPSHPHIQSQEENHGETELKKAMYGYDEPEKIAYTDQQPEEPDHPSITSQEESHGDVVLKVARYGYDKVVKLAYTYQRPDELELKELKDMCDEPGKLHHTYEQPEELGHHNVQSKEAKKAHEHEEEASVKYSQPVNPPEKISPSVQSVESYYHETQAQEPVSRETSPGLPNYQETQSEEPGYEHYQSKRPDYQQKPSEEQYYQQGASEETSYHHKHSEVQSEALDFRSEHPENLEYKNKRSENSHSVKYNSEHKDVQTPEENTKMFGEQRIKQEYLDLHDVGTEIGHVTSAEQVNAENRPKKYPEQYHRDHSPEESHQRDDSASETYHKELLLKEQDLRYAQQEEPKTLDTHTVETTSKDVHPEQQEQTNSTVTDGQSSGSRSKESRDTQEEDGQQKPSEKNINGHCEADESEYSEERSDGPKLSDEIREKSPVETASDTEETPEEVPFDFLEGTKVLDTSLMRSRASLGRKRNHRTPATGACTPDEEADPDYWMFRDSTEPKRPPEKDSIDEEKEETSPEPTPENSPTSVKSPTKKGGIFSGIISPSILKGRRKSRNKTSEDGASKAEPKESKEPTSPEKDKSESSSHSLNWLQALKKKKKKIPK